MSDDSTDTGKKSNGDVSATSNDKKEEEKTTEDNEGVKILMDVFGKDPPAVAEQPPA